MAGEQKRKQREYWVVAATLLGYNISLEGRHYYNLQFPSGDWLLTDGLPKAFTGKWTAAYWAIQHAGLNPNDIRPDRAPRINSSSVSEIFERRNEQARVSYCVAKMRGKRK